MAKWLQANGFKNTKKYFKVATSSMKFCHSVNTPQLYHKIS